MRELAQRVLSLLCRALNAQVGAQYVAEDGGATLRLAGAYAAVSGMRERWRLGEGLVGQAALEKRRIIVSDIPEDGFSIHWGLGDTPPRHLMIFPLLHEGEARGVIELGALTPFCEKRLGFLDIVSASVGQAIGSAEARARIEQLLEESRAQGEELIAQQEELRQVNDTLEEHTRALELQKENLLATEAALRQKADELERTSRYKSEFLANMSHELRTPLNSSLILAKLLVDNKDGNLAPEQIKYAQSIYSAGNDLLVLINDILDLSKIEAGKIDLEIETMAIATIVGAISSAASSRSRRSGGSIPVGVEPGAPGDDRDRSPAPSANSLQSSRQCGEIHRARRRAPARAARGFAAPRLHRGRHRHRHSRRASRRRSSRLSPGQWRDQSQIRRHRASAFPSRANSPSCWAACSPSRSEPGTRQRLHSAAAAASRWRDATRPEPATARGDAAAPAAITRADADRRRPRRRSTIRAASC